MKLEKSGIHIGEILKLIQNLENKFGEGEDDR